MSFLRHGESIDPMSFVPLGASGFAHSQCSSDAMSSGRLFLGRLLSSRACLRFAGCEQFCKTILRRTMIFQRTATTPLIRCLTPRVHSNLTLPFPSPVNVSGGSMWLREKRLHPCFAAQSGGAGQAERGRVARRGDLGEAQGA